MINDIIFCNGGNCPIKKSCYRFTNKIPGRKVSFVRVPYNFSSNYCKHFMSNRPDDSKIRLRAYEIWQKMDCPHGKSVENWLQAEKELIDNVNYP